MTADKEKTARPETVLRIFITLRLRRLGRGTSTCKSLIFVRKEGKNDNNLLIIKDVCFILIFFEYLCSQICEKVKD